MHGFYPADQHGHRNIIRRVEVIEVDDKLPQQKMWVKGLHGEEIKNAYRAQPFGLSSVPPAGSEGYAFSMAGRPDQIFFLVTEHKDYRPVDKKPGETFLYDQFGNIISMVKDSNDGKIEIIVNSVDGKVTVKGAKTVTVESGEDVNVKAPQVKVEAPTEITGYLTTGSGMTSAEAHRAADFYVTHA